MEIRDNFKLAAEKGNDMTKEVLNKSISYMMGAFGLVAGLAWNEAIRSGIEYLFPLDKNSLLAKFIYAALVTALLVWATFILVKFTKKEEK